MTYRRAGLLAILLTFALPGSVRAHEPLWGESPQTFAFGVIHPQMRFGFEEADHLYQGSRRVTNHDGMRRSRFETMLGIQYSPRTSLNIRLELPYASVRTVQQIGGQQRAVTTSGLGDLVLSAKSRFYLRTGPNWKVHQSAIVGLQLPTGDRGGAYPDGTPLPPSVAPAGGQLGLLLGYTFAWERRKDTTWFSASYLHEFGDERRGDRLDLHASYGYWIRTAARPQDTGIIVTAGPVVEWMERDHLRSGAISDTGSTRLGIQGNFIVTQGPSQYRIGVLFPLYHHYNGSQLGTGLHFRAGWEMLL